MLVDKDDKRTLLELSEPKDDRCEEPQLKVLALTKSFSTPSGDTIDVLRGVSFVAAPGEALAIMGASGAGKSTLLHLLGGLESPDAGKIELHDFSVAAASDSQLPKFRNRQVGFIFQFHNLLTDLTAVENVAMPLMIQGLSQRRSLELATRALETVGLRDRTDQLVSYLSGGEQQRVAVMRALITEPSLVLADEPTGNLDSTIEDEISETLVSYAHGPTNRRRILLVATHNERLARMCDRVMVLQDGKLHNA